MKHCNSCNQAKPLAEFNIRTVRGKPGYQSKCKSCQSEWYKTHKFQHVANVRTRQRLLLKENRDRVLAYLSTHPCVDCGEGDPLVLQFDHVRGKKRAGVMTLVKQACSWKMIKEEIAKCEVRCCNCHTRVTAQRNGRHWMLLAV